MREWNPVSTNGTHKARNADTYPTLAGLDYTRKVRRGGVPGFAPYYARDKFGIVRNAEGIPQTPAGIATPLGFAGLDDECPSVIAAVQVACGLAATAWAQVSNSAACADGRDVVICLVQGACDVSDCSLSETFAIAPHEVNAAQVRVSRRIAVDMAFIRQFSRARAMMAAGCAYFPWYAGDGRIPA
ncbi:hypothetical protein LUX29_05115 [Aureimonas altamirensis]|uniref:hypothetical protein n=1 Tax=Aureimonas altamirensis TaxID=370622 RepID=UPI001E414221|nr:hypothetical protein [Aureimonas altamirensis]UHD46597.1 hypothetical protein LUX29_05115 [Aureimonas altamirensis]